MVGLEGRSDLLKKLAGALESTYFPGDRPGHLVDYLQSHVQDNKLPIDALWKAVMSLGQIWPARIELNGVKLGDVWPLLPGEGPERLVPFHKLSQWLTYSLTEALETTLGWTVDGIENMTGLPEYRNGGLLVDHGVLTLKPDVLARGREASGDEIPSFEGQDPVIVEWRALTVVYLDKIHRRLEKRWHRQLKLAQVLEGGTWTAGREIAAQKRTSGGPPINIKVQFHKVHERCIHMYYYDFFDRAMALYSSPNSNIFLYLHYSWLPSVHVQIEQIV